FMGTVFQIGQETKKFIRRLDAACRWMNRAGLSAYDPWV
ncbi:MAG: hypothetical protein ACI83N_001324, partial [Hydrogenophaga sp.]